MAAYVSVAIAAGLYAERNPDQSEVFWIVMIMSTVAFVAVCSLTGPAPKWRWGDDDADS